MRLILIRHGETDYNRRRKYQGQRDVSLNRTGKTQAMILGRKLASEKIGAIVSSDLKRAYETAMIVAKPHRIGVKAEPLLRERAFGDWEGMTFKEIQKKYGRFYERWVKSRGTLRPPNGESFPTLVRRVKTAYKKILREFGSCSQAVVVVTHAGPLRILISTLIKLPLKNLWALEVKPCGISVVEVLDGVAVLKLLNDTCRLEKRNQ